LGPIPIIAWILAIWTVRRPKIAGRAPIQAALGWMLLLWQPRGGRIGGRAARDRGSHPLLGAFTIEGAPAPAPTAKAGPARADRQDAPRPRRARPTVGRCRAKPASPAMPVGPLSGVQQLHVRAQHQHGGAR
jgi:hypothetical protein